MSARLELQLAASQLQVASARAIIEALLDDDCDPPEHVARRSMARDWLATNQARHEETLNALGALLRGDADA